MRRPFCLGGGLLRDESSKPDSNIAAFVGFIAFHGVSGLGHATGSWAARPNPYRPRLIYIDPITPANRYPLANHYPASRYPTVSRYPNACPAPNRDPTTGSRYSSGKVKRPDGSDQRQPVRGGRN